MTQRKVKFVENETYHVYNRGSFKHLIFHDSQDYERFRKMLYICNGSKRFRFSEIIKNKINVYTMERGTGLVDILSFVQMSNHFHLMLHVPKSKVGGDNAMHKNYNNNVAIFMKRLTSSYSQYYNKKYDKTGVVFEGRFKSEHVKSSEYYKYLFSYLHLNPLKIFQTNWRDVGIADFPKAVNFLQNYPHSSFNNYFTSHIPVVCSKIVNKQEFLSKLEKGTDLNQEIFDWIKYKTIE